MSDAFSDGGSMSDEEFAREWDRTFGISKRRRARELLRERLAQLEHEQWAHWTSHMLETLKPLLDAATGYGTKEFETAWAAVERWRRQIATPYVELLEREKNSGRVWADKTMALFDERRRAVGIEAFVARHKLETDSTVYPGTDENEPLEFTKPASDRCTWCGARLDDMSRKRMVVHGEPYCLECIPEPDE